MLTKTKIICISFCVVNLSACMTSGANHYSTHQPYDYQTSPLYPEGYDETVVYSNTPFETKQEIMVPNTYHVGATQSPIASKNLDKTWINNQNPAGYTIQLSESEKAAYVARILQKAPKNERTAEVKSQLDGKAYYKGLYGSFPNPEAATKALDALPTDIKEGAKIESWGTVQQSISE